MQSQVWHEHASDEEDEESPRIFHPQRRTRSFSEAEESVGRKPLSIKPRRLLDNGYNSKNNRGLNDDDDDAGGASSYWSPNRGGLHHRHPVHGPIDDDEHEEFDDEKKETGSTMSRQRHPIKPNNSSRWSSSSKKKRRGTALHKKRKRKCTKWLWKGVACAILAYICVVFCIIYPQMMPDDGSQGSFHFRSLFTGGTHTHLARLALDEKESLARQQVRLQTQERAQSRRQRTRPPILSVEEFSASALLSYEILSVDQEERSSHPVNDQLPVMQPAALEELCGFHAQNASLAYPHSYLARDALNSRASVLITGILNPLGFHLALALKERCGVQVMTGIDPMFPNTVKNRLAILEQIQILTTNIPGLRKPILIPFIGLDPKVVINKKNGVLYLDVTGELDLNTFSPTHIVHLSSYTPQAYQHPHKAEQKNLQSPYVTPDYDPLLFPIRSTIGAMEQTLVSIATTTASSDGVPAAAGRAHLTYASANRHWQASHDRDDILHTHTRRIDEVLADAYHSLYGVYSVAMRLPKAVYGTWGHPNSEIHRVMQAATMAGNETGAMTPPVSDSSLDMVHVDDIVDAFISAMQFRAPSSKPAAFELTSGATVALSHVRDTVDAFLSTSTNETVSVPAETQTTEEDTTLQTRQFLEWTPHTPVESGLLRLLAWYLDRKNPYGITSSTESQFETGDALLTRHLHETCAADDVVCHSSRQYMPCASECSSRSQCTPSMFDDMVEMVQDVTEGCDIILYTQVFGKDVEDLELTSEYMDEGDPLICNFAFVSSTSKLVETVIHKVPNVELANLGVAPRPEDLGKVGAIQERKLEKLNGKLLYRGWVLIWKDTPEPLPKTDDFLLKLSPGRLFSKDTLYAVFIDPGFAVSPTADDVKFLVHEMHRSAWEQRTVRRKAQPKARFRLPAEPERRAMILMSQLKYQYSKEMERLPADSKISAYQATKFIRYENGETHLGKEPAEVKLQREFYERIPSIVNRDPLRSPLEPLYQYSIKDWARSRWVVHDMTREEARELRCDWYQEHIQWGSGLDQLSFAHVMAKRELERRMIFEEPDDHARKAFADKTEMRKLLTDSHEWYPMQTEQNKYFCAHDELEVLPYEQGDAKKENGALEVLEPPPNNEAALFVRIVSDRIMSFARKAWNDIKSVDESTEIEQ